MKLNCFVDFIFWVCVCWWIAPTHTPFFLFLLPPHPCFCRPQHRSCGSHRSVDHWLWPAQDSALNPVSSHGQEQLPCRQLASLVLPLALRCWEAVLSWSVYKSDGILHLAAEAETILCSDDSILLCSSILGLYQTETLSHSSVRIFIFHVTVSTNLLSEKGRIDWYALARIQTCLDLTLVSQ